MPSTIPASFSLIRPAISESNSNRLEFSPLPKPRSLGLDYQLLNSITNYLGEDQPQPLHQLVPLQEALEALAPLHLGQGYFGPAHGGWHVCTTDSGLITISQQSADFYSVAC